MNRTIQAQKVGGRNSPCSALSCFAEEANNSPSNNAFVATKQKKNEKKTIKKLERAPETQLLRHILYASVPVNKPPGTRAIQTVSDKRECMIATAPSKPLYIVVFPQPPPPCAGHCTASQSPVLRSYTPKLAALSKKGKQTSWVLMQPSIRHPTNRPLLAHASLPGAPTHLLHLHHVELEPLEVKEQHVREAGDARALQGVPLLVALGAQELVVPGEHLSTTYIGRSDRQG